MSPSNHYGTLRAIHEGMKAYIKVHIEKGMYVGEPEVLHRFYTLDQLLEKEDPNETTNH